LIRYNCPMQPLVINGRDLKIDDVVAVAKGRPVELDPLALPAIQRARDGVQRIVSEGRIAYGITTGFGRFKDTLIPPDQVALLQTNLVRSHAAGVGPDLDEASVRAMLLVRANTLASGYSGARVEVVQLLIDMLNSGVHPVIPSRGSLGASGDLSPLAHMALVMIGEGEAQVDGERMSGADALSASGLDAVTLQAKEGLALLNGTTQMVAMGALLVRRAINLVILADAAAALSLEALNGTDRAFDPRVHQLRPHPRQIESAAFLRACLRGSELVRKDLASNVQDPYTLRCVPQVHGAVRDSIAYAQWVIDIELNSVSDNPLIFVDEESGDTEVISAGNFHGEPIALAMDYVKLALTDLGNMSERRIAKLVDADSNQGVLPMFLTSKGGIESGFMMAQYSAAALASENKVFAHPASADTIPSSANVEDHVSMGVTSTRHAEMVLANIESILAIELLCAAQGVDFRTGQPGGSASQLGDGTAAAYRQVRGAVDFQVEDRPLSGQMEAVRRLVSSGEIKLAVEEATGNE